MTAPPWIAVTLEVIEVLDRLAIPYVVCGSTASIIHGVVRATVDTDLIADLQVEHVQHLVTSLQERFYIDADSVIEAIRRKSSFNVIHHESVFKVDVFVPKPRPFDQAQLAHRVSAVIVHDPERSMWVLSAEDIVLAKLEWFRLGNEVSERQWRDVLGVLKTQQGRLDHSYMLTMAAQLGVSDLLSRAFVQMDQ